MARNTIKKSDMKRFHAGQHYECYEFMGAHISQEGGQSGVRFTTWAPNAQSVSVVGDFNDWHSGQMHALERVSDGGLWSAFISGINEGNIYKYEIISSDGKRLLKSDPYAFYAEKRPNTASVVANPTPYSWNDDDWLNKRAQTDLYKSPLNIYEVHMGSWRRRENGEFMTYAELADLLPKYAKDMGYTHIELMPLMEHPLDASWGYLITGYYAVTSRYGTIDEFKRFINACHENGIGVILDWVPGHFCKDAHGLYRYDGTPLYEYQDPRKAETEGWGAANFDLGRPEVKSFLISNAFYWLKEFHIDGFRVDAVANMLYLDYGKQDGQWVPNIYGGRENLEAIGFLHQLNEVLFKEYPNIIMIAEESTTWPMVSKPVYVGGLGFNFKWNMGWMNDTLRYITMDPIYRKYYHSLMTFSMMYHYSENFILPISHDEVVHGKKSLVDKMWGDHWNKFAGLRVYMLYMYTHPGKKTVFMGCEFAQFIEWRFYEQLEWFLIERFDMHKKTHDFFRTLNHFYLKNPALWQLDYYAEGFEWIDPNNTEQSIFVYMRKTDDPSDTLVVLCNFTPIVYYDYKIGVPYPGAYEEILNTDDIGFGGSGQVMGQTLYAEEGKWHNQDYHLTVKVPPMAGVVLKLHF
ncbi:1,4-alpha-glucan branching protein GlgB [Mahella sp.]|uniref:1,4-alpha-glucan branching protein GlgB n=1 Tax=Mahella sp. TaxID=2798721 RepID=UPI0025C45D26|nr:1,4-alpha-glucan branching protein GlgB [Mahella sp.]MBZ4665556.1 1,4-alpha-glucan branching enzyme [Mahella sp.]